MKKKYLIKGALASILGGFMAGCHETELSTSLIEQKQQAYEELFEKEFGKVDPNQDWGFGEESVAARTRAAYIMRSQSDPSCPDIDVNAVKNYAATISKMDNNGICTIELANPKGIYKRITLKINTKC